MPSTDTDRLDTRLLAALARLTRGGRSGATPRDLAHELYGAEVSRRQLGTVRMTVARLERHGRVIVKRPPPGEHTPGHFALPVTPIFVQPLHPRQAPGERQLDRAELLAAIAARRAELLAA
jgi:hypothetical protein